MLNKTELNNLNKLVKQQDPRLAVVFNALSDGTRCKVFRMLLKRKQNDLSISDFAKTLKITASAASQHVKILELTGLIVKSRTGNTTSLKPNLHDPLVRALKKSIIKKIFQFFSILFIFFN